MTRKKNIKKPKLEVKFDSDARRNFLTGFHKRNLQKKAFYKSKLEKRLAMEKQRIKAAAKKSVGRTSSSHSILPEVEKIIGFSQADLEDERKTKSESFILGTKTVTICSLDDIHTKLPPLEEEDSEGDDKFDLDVEDQVPLLPKKKAKTMMKRTSNKLLQQSKAYKAALKFKQKSKKSRAKNRLARTGIGGGGGSSTGAEEGQTKKSLVKHGNQKQVKRLDPKSKKGKRAKVDPRRRK